MKKLTYLIIISLAILTSCNDKIDLDDLVSQPKIALYCFPSTADTTIINITRTTPVSSSTNTNDKIEKLTNAKMTYLANGMSYTVRPYRDGNYYVIGHQMPGYNIVFKASADSLPDITATATIPDTPGITGIKTVPVTEIYNNAIRNFVQMQTSIKTGNDTEHSFYAVKAQARKIRPNSNPAKNDTIISWAKIYNNDEKLLNPPSDADEDFGFNNNYYKDFYIFEGKNINSDSYTLRLNIDPTENGTDYPVQFRIILYKITYEYYKMIKSINDMSNNVFARYGLSQISPTFSNVNGGIGLLGTFTMTASDWTNMP